MSEVGHDCCFILLETKYGRKKDLHRPSSKDKIEVLPGTLLILINRAVEKGMVDLLLETFDTDKSIQVNCYPGEVEDISSAVVDLLRPIPTCHERLEVFRDTEWIQDGQRLRVGDWVFVKLKGVQEELKGILRYKGSEFPDSKGILFGVQLEEAKGNCDGMYRKKRFFKTEQDCAVFIPLHKIRRQRDDWHKNARLRATEDSNKRSRDDSSNYGLKIGERVVWMSDIGAEKGVVKWIGTLPGESDDSNVTVGVEFDNPVGTGTGKYNDHRLFYTQPKHASLIPLMGLMKEEEFENGSSNAEPVIQELNSSPAFISQQQKLLDEIGGRSRPERPPKNCYLENHSVMKSYDMPNYSGDKLNTSGARSADVARSYPISHSQEAACMNPYERSRLQDDLAATSSSGSKSSSSGFSREADPDLDVGSMVEVAMKTPHYGVIRWISEPNPNGKRTAGLEMEEEVNGATDGTFKLVRYFTCAPKKALFVPLYKCSKDKRFATERKISSDFGGKPTPDVPGDVAPPDLTTEAEFRQICGKHHGIQGHHNSCYLDATLFCMFYFTTVFDFIFNRQPRPGDLPQYPEVQRVLKDGIVNPLRKFNYVRADKVLKLRSLLDKLATVEGMMSEEKDPEEFLSALLTDIMKADPLLHLSSGEHTYFYQLFMEKDDKLLLPTTQKLVELSFLQGNVKLKKVPSCLMIQMPRFGKDYKMFHRIVPSLQLDITDILENFPRDCIVCGSLATNECKDCYQVHGPGLNTTAFCDNCVRRSHQHASRRNHEPQKIPGAANFLPVYERMKEEALMKASRNGEANNGDVAISLPREVMELFAVICIQTSHYVSFVKCGTGPGARWVFFDSMADRMGEQSGYNIPEVVHVPDMSNWLDERNLSLLLQKADDKDLPEHLRRILCDGYMCMYQSPNVMMYN